MVVPAIVGFLLCPQGPPKSLTCIFAITTERARTVGCEGLRSVSGVVSVVRQILEHFVRQVEVGNGVAHDQARSSVTSGPA